MILMIKAMYHLEVVARNQPETSLGPLGGEHWLGYLLTHASLQYARLTAAELEPLGLAPREWAALNCLYTRPGLSQIQTADLLGVDRTTMLALVDSLQGKGLVERRPQPEDRRKNMVAVTAKGRDLRQRAARVIDGCESQFLAPLGEAGARRLRDALAAVVTHRR
jgi:DNA-binding MarR family transcriptional regulator